MSYRSNRTPEDQRRDIDAQLQTDLQWLADNELRHNGVRQSEPGEGSGPHVVFMRRRDGTLATHLRLAPTDAPWVERLWRKLAKRGNRLGETGSRKAYDRAYQLINPSCQSGPVTITGLDGCLTVTMGGRDDGSDDDTAFPTCIRVAIPGLQIGNTADAANNAHFESGDIPPFEIHTAGLTEAKALPALFLAISKTMEAAWRYHADRAQAAKT